MNTIYLLKDVARLSGYSTHTIKYYLRLGLLHEMGRSPVTNFRYFDDTAFDRLKVIQKLKEQNISLKQIKEKLEVLK